MKRRVLSAVLGVLVLLGALSGCGGETVEPEGGENETPPETVTPEVEDKAPEGEDKAPVGEDKAPEVEDKAPEGEDKAPEDGDDEPETVPEGTLSVEDGEYEIEVESNSSMFKVVSCRLTVRGGELSAVVTLSGTGYTKLFMGTAEEAAGAAEDEVIPFVEDGSGAYTFALSVPALDTPVSVAAYSAKKETWYDRELIFRSDSLPEGAADRGTQVTAASLGLEDGDYTVEAALGGGSGRASVESPAKMTVTGGEAVVTLRWSSDKYDYMKVDGVKYEPVSTEGGSVFEVPVSAFDADTPIIADTTAMSAAHEVEYTLRLDSASIARS